MGLFDAGLELQWSRTDCWVVTTCIAFVETEMETSHRSYFAFHKHTSVHMTYIAFVETDCISEMHLWFCSSIAIATATAIF